MSEKVAEVLNAISRVPTQLLLALAVSSAFILFIPEDLASTLAVDEFRKSYRIYLGPGLVVISAWLVARAVAAAARGRARLLLQRYGPPLIPFFAP